MEFAAAKLGWTDAIVNQLPEIDQAAVGGTCSACWSEIGMEACGLNLTEHFTDAELGVAGARIRGWLRMHEVSLRDDPRANPRAVRGRVKIHDGHIALRSITPVWAESQTSWHQFDAEPSRSRLCCLPHDYQAVFDWIRLWRTLAALR